MLIQDSIQLNEICLQIKDHDFLVIDTEFIRTNTYYPILCLIQIATTDTLFAVDMLSDMDFTALEKILKNSNICKIIHSPRQDLEGIYYRFGFIIENIFDTQLASQFLGLGEQISYEALVKHYLVKQIDKKWQHSNWLQRPLIDDQLNYALLDVSLLKEIYPKIIEDLKRRNRLQWALDENESRYGTIKNFETCPEEQLKKFSPHFREIKQFAAALALIVLRENKAKSSNLNRNRVLEDEDIVSIVRSMHVNDRLCKKLGMTSEINNIFEAKISDTHEQIIKRIISDKDLHFQNKNFIFDLLKVLLKKIAADEQMAPTLIATTNDLLKIATGSFSEKFVCGWRKEIFTDIIESFLLNKKGLYCNKKILELR